MLISLLPHYCASDSGLIGIGPLQDWQNQPRSEEHCDWVQWNLYSWSRRGARLSQTQMEESREALASFNDSRLQVFKSLGRRAKANAGEALRVKGL